MKHKLRIGVLATGQLLLIVTLLLLSVDTKAQCELPCNNLINVSLDLNCQAVITLDMVLEGFDTLDCSNPLAIEILDADGSVIPTNPIVDETYVGQTLIVQVVDQTNNNSCWGELLVEDKNPPYFISCADTTIFCTDNNDASVVGGAIAADACSDFSLSSSDQLIDNGDCVTSTIIRTWTATDSYGTATDCVQEITVTTPTLADVEFPDDVTLECDALFEPEHLEGIISTGIYDEDYPNVNGMDIVTVLCNLGAVKEDQSVQVCVGTIKILRTWSVTDWCTGEVLVEEQVIKIEDSSIPEIICPEDISISTDANSCTGQLELPAPVGMSDACSSATLTYEVDASSGVLNQSANGDWSIAELAIGVTTITYTVNDGCDNTSTCTFDIAVSDNIPPIPVCHEFTVTGLNGSGISRVYAATFDDGSHDNCNPVFLKVRRHEIGACVQTNGDDDNVENGYQEYYDDYTDFCCSDIGDSPIMVILRVYDIDPGVGPIVDERHEEGGDLYGHYNDCMVEVTAEDNLPPFILCLPDITVSCNYPIDLDDLSDFGSIVNNSENREDIIINDPSNPTLSQPYDWGQDGFAGDNCNATVTEVIATDLVCLQGTITRTFTATDDFGRTTTCSQTITVEDFTPPTYSFPVVELTVACGDAEDFSIVGEPTATDDCSQFAIGYEDLFLVTNDPCKTKRIRTWTIADWCTGETIEYEQKIIEVDEIAPSFDSVPADITVENDCDDAIPTVQTLTATDSCSEATVSLEADQIIAGSCANNFVIIRTWIASDVCGNTASAIQEITLEDTTEPSFTITPNDLTIECNMVPEPIDVQASDECDGLVPVTFIENLTEGNCPGNYTITRTWTASDECGNVATNVQVIVVEDTTPPTISSIGNDVTIECDENAIEIIPNINDNCDSSPEVISEETISDGDCPDSYIVTRTWTATDNCGNVSSRQQVITVQDTTTPVLKDVPDDMTLNCEEAIPAAAQPTATDNCDDDVSISLNEEMMGGACTNNFTIIRTWTATDNCGNEVSHVQTILIVDDAAPVFSEVPLDTTVECNAVPLVTTPTVIDNCDDDVGITFVENREDGSCPNNYTLTRTWTASDNCGNQTTTQQVIIVDDTTPPVITGIPADEMFNCDAVNPTDPPTPNIMDNCDDDVTLTFEEEFIPGTCPDTYMMIRIWTATDDCGNSTTAEQTISVGDTAGPELSGVPDNVTVECDAIPTIPTVTATDDCDDDITIEFNENIAQGVCEDNQTITRSWTAVDDCGNVSTAEQTIVVQDTTAPSISGVPDDITIDCTEVVPFPAEPTITDNCDTDVMTDYEQLVETGPCPNSIIYTRTWTATDNCGNSTVETRMITFQDITPPVINGVPDDITISCNDDLPIAASPTISDNCDEMATVVYNQDTFFGACADEGRVVRTWTATDACGNVTVVSQRINLVDDVAPVLSGIPADATVECDNIPSTAGVEATDNCDDDVIIELNEVLTDSLCADSYTLTRTWTASDNCGNQDVQTQVILIQDTTPPLLNGVPNDITASCDDLPDISTINATDNCDDDVEIILDETVEGSCPDNIVIIRTWTATDNCGNATSQSQMITTFDSTAPVLMGIPEDVTVDCSEIPDPAEPTAEDACDEMVDIDYVENKIDGACPESFTLVRTWTATDQCNNQSMMTQTIFVQDTISPLLFDIPVDLTVECNAIPNPENPNVDENCDPSITIIFDQTLSNVLCTNSYTLRRTWTAVDNCGNTSSTFQTIVVEDTTPPTVEGVPNDITVDCSQVPAPPLLGIDVVGVDNCDEEAIVTFEEIRNDGECAQAYTLTRTWTAVDNCNNTGQVTQVISVVDTIPPQVTCADEFSIELRDSCAYVAEIMATAVDNCSPDGNLIYSHFIDYYTNGNIYDPSYVDSTFDGLDATGYYPVGIHEVTFMVIDECGLEGTCTTTVNIIDNDSPQISCDDLEVNIAAVDYVVIAVDDLITGVNDCSGVTLSFSLNELVTLDTFLCDQVSADQQVFVYAIDDFGNSTGCIAFVDVNDPNLFCNNLTGDVTTVSGRIADEMGDEIEDVKVELSDGMLMNTFTNAIGDYVFDDVPVGSNYTVRPEKNDDWLNGVTTYDLVLIQKHILGVEQIASPYKLIAADANNSGSVTALDIIELRKLILTINEECPNNTSWRFIEEDFLFPLADNPFETSFPESYSINNLESLMSNINFTAIKTGDVNSSALPSSGFAKVENRSRGKVEFKTSDIDLQVGEEYRIPFTTEQIKELYGYQYTIIFDVNALSFIDVEIGQLTELTKENFGFKHTAKGVVTTSWSSLNAIDLDEDAVLFELIFTAKNNASLSEVLKMNSTITKAEGYRKNGDLLGVDLLFEKEKTLVKTKIEEVELYQNNPNPFSKETIISFNLPESQEATLTIFDVSGKVISIVDKEWTKGYNEVIIDAETLPFTGVFFYQLETASSKQTKKMILMNR